MIPRVSLRQWLPAAAGGGVPALCSEGEGAAAATDGQRAESQQVH